MLNDIVKSDQCRLDLKVDLVFHKEKSLKAQNAFNVKDNRNNSVTKIVFSVRSRTIDLKTLQSWMYFDNLIVICERRSEIIEHFMMCKAYENIPPEKKFKLICDEDTDKQFTTVSEVSPCVVFVEQPRLHQVC